MASTEVAQQEPKKRTLADLIEMQKPAIAKALPRHMNPERMARIATTVLRQTPALSRCTPESFLGALMTASQLGLEPGALGEAYFVPYGTVCTFIPGYRGLIKLARQSGLVADIYAEVVRANDSFQVKLGLNRDIQHDIVDRVNRGDVTDVYAVAKFKDGTSTFVTMTVAEVEAIRTRSKAGRNGPWVTDWEAMAKKTAVKQLSKWLPLSAEFNTAAVLDGSVRTEVGDLVDVKPDFVDGEVADAPAIAAGPVEDDPQVVDAPPPNGSPAEVLMASKAQLAKLKNIRAAERYETDAEWFDYIDAAVQVRVSRDADLTFEQAESLIEIFNQDAAE